MKLESITLENFGFFGRKKLAFAGAPLVLVYGANEAGKTTALNGIRQAILGFKMRTPYLNGSQMTAEVTGHMKDGTPIEFLRRKGRPDTVTGSAYEKQLSDQDLQSLLGGLDLQSYEYLLGFSQEELRQGQETLKSARLSEAIAGGSLGGIHRLETLRLELSEALSGLYKPRGSTSAINAILSQITSTREALKSSEVVPAVIEQWRTNLRELEQQAELIKIQREQLFRRKRLAERLLEALPAYRNRCQLVQQLSDLEVPSGLSLELLHQCQQLVNDQQQLSASLDTELRELEADQASAESLNDNAELLNWEDRIEALGHQADAMLGLRNDQSTQQEELREARDRHLNLLRDLQLESLPEKLREINIPAPQRQRIEELVSQSIDAEQQLLTLSGKLDSAEQVLRQHSIEGMDPPENLLDLGDLVAELDKAESELQLHSQNLTVQQQDREHLERENSLTRYLEPQSSLNPDSPIPHPVKVEEFAERWEMLSKTQNRYLADIKQHEEELQAIRNEQKQQHLPEAEELTTSLQQLAGQRDGILSQWMDELSEPLLAASIGREDQQERVRELQRIALKQDQAQRDLLDVADLVAAANQRQQRMTQTEAKCDQTQQQLLETEQQLTNLRQQWQDCWSQLPIEPNNPVKMQTWIADFNTWSREVNRQRQAEKRVLSLQKRVDELREQIVKLWPTSLRQRVSVQVLQKQISEWEQARHDLEANRRRSKETQASIEALHREIAKLQSICEEAHTHYARWLDDSGLRTIVQETWPLNTAPRLLRTLDSLRREQQAIEKAERQRLQTQRRLSEFEQSMSDLATSMGVEAETTKPEYLAKQWLDGMREARRKKSQRIELLAKIKHREAKCKDLRRRLASIADKLKTAEEKGGTQAVANTQMLIEKSRRLEDLQASLGETSAALSTFAQDPAIIAWLATEGENRWISDSSSSVMPSASPTSNQRAFSESSGHAKAQNNSSDDTANNLEHFCDSLSKIDQTSLELDGQDAANQLSQCDEQSRQIDQEIGSLRERIAHTAQNKLAQETRQKISDLRGELVELSEQWVVARLAQDLLSRSIDLFTKENEPRILQLARGYFRQLTAGRYVHIEHDSDNKDMFVVRNQQGQTIPPDRLSTGTREQLYLAIRMAFIAQYFDNHEPLPVVMDDCFVNFDDRRTRLALEVIANWDPSVQTILLSCHSRVPKILAEIAPQTRVIDLHDDTTHRASEFVTDQAETEVSTI